MRIASNETTLVIAGAWNPAILTPEWMLRHPLGRAAGEQHQVRVAMPVGVLFEFPRYEMDGISFSARNDSLILFPATTTVPALEHIEGIGARILAELRHTPVTGLGHNFEFRDENPDPETLNVFTAARQRVVDFAPEGFDVAGDKIVTSLRRDDVIINLDQTFDGASLVVKFNFHHPITQASDAVEILNGQGRGLRITESLRIAREMIQNIFGDLQDVQDQQ